MTKTVEVTQSVIVDVPDGFLSDEFMKEFRENFYDFYTPEEHLYHLAQLHVRGLADNDSFIEGYGKASEIGIKFTA